MLGTPISYSRGERKKEKEGKKRRGEEKREKK